MEKTSTSAPNTQQQEAIYTTEGPLLIIAGPGSGKTFTLVERIYHLISERNIQPEQIFVSTFTEKAAAELITRVSKRLADDDITVNLNEMYIGTFHSICLRFIEEHRESTRLMRNFTLLDQFDQQYFLYQNLSHYQQIEGSEHILGNTSWWERAKNLMTSVNKVSEEALNPEELLNADEPEIQALARCYQQYKTHLKEESYLDFSTIQVEALRLLEEHPDILNEIRDKIEYLMVDEYQDTNTIQERILFKLAEPDFNLCVVGDDDQGLYRFRGATIRNILEFPQNDFLGATCKKVKLTTNYRSHPDIIQFYNDWMDLDSPDAPNWTIDGTTFRHEKKILPNFEADFTDMPTVLKISGDPDAQDWHAQVLNFLYHLRDIGTLTDWNQVAFLFSSVKNHRAVALARTLEEGGIHVYAPRSNLFFDREEIRLIIGALIFLFPQFPEARQQYVRTKPEIWDYYDEECVRSFITEAQKPENKPLLDWCRRQANTHRTLTAPTDYAFSGLFYELLQFPLFSQHLGEATQGGVIDSRPARNLAIFSQLLNKYEYLQRINVLLPEHLNTNLRRLFNNFFRFLKEGGIEEYEDASEYAPKGCVSFMTIHQSKGLEFPVVIVESMYAIPKKQHADLDNLLQQKYYSKKPFEPLEQTKFYDFWRLFYTAFSRAQNLLLLTCQEKPSGRWRVPSKYLKPVYDQLLPWQDEAFQPENLTLETIKDVELKNEYSFTSHITVFENCARQYKFYRDLGFAPIRRNPILFGTVVHQTIEDIHKAVLRNEEHIVTVEQIENWFNANYIHLSRQERLYLNPGAQKAALDHVLRYAHRERETWDLLQETEVQVSLVKDSYILKGHIDLIRGEDGTVEIIDFKSEKKPDLVSDRERINHYRRQLEVYAHIIEGRTDHKISKMHLYCTGEENSNPYITFDKDALSIDQTMEAFDQIVARIENKDFKIAARPDNLCRNCDMKAYCDAL